MNWNSKSVKFESQSHSETISETSQYRTESLEWEWDLSRFYRICITVGYWMVCTEMHDIFVIQFGHFCFFADTTRKPRAGEEDGRGKSETNRRWVCWKLHMKRRNCSQWQQEDSSVTNSTTEILLLLTGSYCESTWALLTDWCSRWPISFNHQASIASFPGLSTQI